MATNPSMIRCALLLAVACTSFAARAEEAPPASARVVVATHSLSEAATPSLQQRLRRAVDSVCTEAARTMVVGRQEYLADCRQQAMADALHQAEGLRTLVARRQ